MCVETGEQVTGEQMSPLSAKSFSSSTHIPTFVYVCVCVCACMKSVSLGMCDTGN